MKRIIIILFLILPFYVFSQDAMTLSEVVEVPVVNKDELFIRARQWYNENFKSSKDVLQVSDKETGELLGKGIMDISYTYKYMGLKITQDQVSFQFNVWVKDGKFKYEMTNFIEKVFAFDLITTTDIHYKGKWGYNEDKINEIYGLMKQSVKDKAKLLLDDLKIKMSKTTKSSDW
ncbi:MAG: DUF4468 domain-containing protein [Paludibacter sp.]